jgi:predicted transcriptional regulator
MTLPIERNPLLENRREPETDADWNGSIRAEEVMQADVHCLGPEWTVSQARDLLLTKSISAAPVVDADGRMIGILSKTDLLRCDSAPAAKPLRVQDVMTRDVLSIDRDTDVTRAAAMMSYEGVHRLVVISADRHPIGIVSAIDILRCIARRHGYVVPDRTRHQID